MVYNNPSRNLLIACLLVGVLLLLSLVSANAQSSGDSQLALDRAQLNAFSREAAGDLNLLQISNLETRVHNFATQLRERLPGIPEDGEVLSRTMQLETSISARREYLAKPHSAEDESRGNDPNTGLYGWLGIVGAVLLDLLVVRRPFMAWYRRQWMMFSGRNSVDILGKQMLNRLGFELFIFFISLILVALPVHFVVVTFFKS